MYNETTGEEYTFGKPADFTRSAAYSAPSSSATSAAGTPGMKGLMATNILASGAQVVTGLLGLYFDVKEGRANRRQQERWARANFDEERRQFGVTSSFKREEMDFVKSESAFAKTQQFMSNLTNNLMAKPAALQAIAKLARQRR